MNLQFFLLFFQRFFKKKYVLCYYDGDQFNEWDKRNVLWRRLLARTLDIIEGDEDDPSAFMDRMMLEPYPFRLIEGMIIAGYAVGAERGIFYIRTEYPLAVSRICTALERCREQLLITRFLSHPQGYCWQLSALAPTP